MSPQQNISAQRSYPLSPPPHKLKQESSRPGFENPRTPQSPSHLLLTGMNSFDQATEAGNTTEVATPMDRAEVSGSFPSSFDTMVPASEVAQKAFLQADEVSNKRKRETEDTGDQEQKKVHVEDRRLGIEDLHLDVGKKYLLCRTPHPRFQPNLAEDLFSRYSLNTIANKVARILPNGEKNGLRKTYKGKIKELGISGKFDVAVHDEESPGGLLAMAREPEMEWAVQHRNGKEIENGFSSETRSKLAAAMTMAKGVIPKSAWDSAVLGELDISDKKSAHPPVPVQKVSASASQKGFTSASNGLSRMSKADVPRPKRVVSKRTYEESSFEGYGEGFVDDETVDAGYSTGEGDDRGMSQKRRKKNSSNHGYPPGPMRHNSYGPGMVGA